MDKSSLSYCHINWNVFMLLFRMELILSCNSKLLVCLKIRKNLPARTIQLLKHIVDWRWPRTLTKRAKVFEFQPVKFKCWKVQWKARSNKWFNDCIKNKKTHEKVMWLNPSPISIWTSVVCHFWLWDVCIDTEPKE